MLVAHYIGPPKPGIKNHAAWYLIRLGQKAPFDHCTHTEAIHHLHSDGSVSIASSSVADKGVRVKRCYLQPSHWIITDVSKWDVTHSIAWFQQAIFEKQAYDMRGAIATMLPGRHATDRVFCTEAVLAPFVEAPHYYTPALGLSLCLTVGEDVTCKFFNTA